MYILFNLAISLLRFFAWGEPEACRDDAPLIGESFTRNASARRSTAVSSLGYPCHLEELQKAGFSPERNNSCDGPHQLVFLHAPKTAGESLEAALGVKKSHVVARERRQSLGEEAWRCAFKFSVARNPWARWESWYSFCNSGYGKHLVLPQPYWACLMARSMTVSSWTKHMIVLLRGLETFRPGLRGDLKR